MLLLIVTVLLFHLSTIRGAYHREAFAAFDIVRIYAEPFAHNAGSRRVLEKAGFTCEGMMRNGVYKNGQIHSYCMYALLKEEAVF